MNKNIKGWALQQSKQAHPHTPLTLIPTETYWIAGKLMAICRIPP